MVYGTESEGGEIGWNTGDSESDLVEYLNYEGFKRGSLRRFSFIFVSFLVLKLRAKVNGDFTEVVEEGWRNWLLFLIYDFDFVFLDLKSETSLCITETSFPSCLIREGEDEQEVN